MNTKELLNIFSSCKSEKDFKKLLTRIYEAYVEDNEMLKAMNLCNEDWNMGDDPEISFELTREFSGFYCMAIKVTLNKENLERSIKTSFMKDGLGQESRDFIDIEEFDDYGVLNLQDNRNIADIAERTMELAILQYSLLIKRCGIPANKARALAKECW
jgi:hypothetical protein